MRSFTKSLKTSTTFKKLNGLKYVIHWQNRVMFIVMDSIHLYIIKYLHSTNLTFVSHLHLLYCNQAYKLLQNPFGKANLVLCSDS